MKLFDAVKAVARQLNRVWPKHVLQLGMHTLPVYQRGRVRELVPDRIEPELIRAFGDQARDAGHQRL